MKGILLVVGAAQTAWNEMHFSQCVKQVCFANTRYTSACNSQCWGVATHKAILYLEAMTAMFKASGLLDVSDF